MLLGRNVFPEVHLPTSTLAVGTRSLQKMPRTATSSPKPSVTPNEDGSYGSEVAQEQRMDSRGGGGFPQDTWRAQGRASPR